MDSLADFISKLPLDKISDALSDVTLWWSDLVADVPADTLPLYAYTGFSVIVLILWLLVARVIPKPFGAISWLAVFAILFTPNMVPDDSGVVTGDIAPASIVAVYGLLMKDTPLVMRSLVPILVVFLVGLILGFIWQLIRNIIDTNDKRVRRQAEADQKANLQLAAANYLDIVEDDVPATTKLIKIKKK